MSQISSTDHNYTEVERLSVYVDENEELEWYLQAEDEDDDDTMSYVGFKMTDKELIIHVEWRDDTIRKIVIPVGKIQMYTYDEKEE